LADVIPVNVSREFTPWGWIGSDNVFRPQVRLRGVHWKAAEISADAVLIIERNLQGLVDAAIEASLDPEVEKAVRAEKARKAALKAGLPAPAAPAAQSAAPAAALSPLAAALAARK
jgi:hypothetical protein